MHTGHSVYATLHANNANEAISRLTNPPIDVPKMMLSSLGLLVVQYRNRRTSKRVTLQIAEITETGDAKVVFQYDLQNGKYIQLNKPRRLLSSIALYAGLKPEQVYNEIQEKKKFLDWLVEKKITDVNKVGLLVSKYYRNKK